MGTSPPRHKEEDEDDEDSEAGWERTQAAVKSDPHEDDEEDDDDEDEYCDDAVKQEPQDEEAYVRASPTQYPCDTTKVCYQYSGGFGVCGALPRKSRVPRLRERPSARVPVLRPASPGVAV